MQTYYNVWQKTSSPSYTFIFCKHHNHIILNNFCERISPNNVPFKIYKDKSAFSRKATGAPSSGKFTQMCPVAWAKQDYDDDDNG